MKWVRALLVIGSLYAPVELTRVIAVYAGRYPDIVPAVPFGVEIAVIWFPWVAGAIVWALWRAHRI